MIKILFSIFLKQIIDTFLITFFSTKILFSHLIDVRISFIFGNEIDDQNPKQIEIAPHLPLALKYFKNNSAALSQL